MSTHLSNEIVERFHSQSLTGSDRGVIYDHIVGCETCRRRVVTAEAEGVALRAVGDHILSQEGEEPYHLDPATIEAFVDDTLDAVDRSTAKLHLEDCAECSAEVTDLRESLATMKSAAPAGGYQSEEIRSGRRVVFSMPMRIAAMVALIAFAAIALVAVFRWRSTSPSITTGSQPTPLASPQVPSLGPSLNTGVNPPKLAENPPPKEPHEEPPKVIVKDGPNEIAIDQGGKTVGLPSLPAEPRQALK